MIILFAGNDCEFIEVTQKGTIFLFVKTDERAPAAPNNSVWKIPDKDVYFFNTGSDEGWRLGKKSHLKTSEFYFKGKSSI